MRCGCPNCGAYMIQQEGGAFLGCHCPVCDYRCDACMGTDTVLSRDEIAQFHASGAGRLNTLLNIAEEDAALDEPEETEEPWTNDWSHG